MIISVEIKETILLTALKVTRSFEKDIVFIDSVGFDHIRLPGEVNVGMKLIIS
jgi:hypothetical protein